MRRWRIEDSEELYNINGWGASYFSINEEGNVAVTPKKEGVKIDLKQLMDELQLRDVAAPVLIRFPDILDNRIEKISGCFKIASDEYKYKGTHFIVYPIKVNQMRPVVEEINALEPTMKATSDSELRGMTQVFKDRLAQGEDLDDLLPEAFAVVREAAWRVLGQRHYDVQLIGGIVLHQGRIAEMKTGEGKTLVSTLPAYLNALTGEGVHVVTVNDYLALRDSQWVGQVFKWLGLTVGCIQNTMNPMQRREQYACDVTYGTNSEFGFDYLRDNGMATSAQEQVQRGYSFAIIDEVDSILVDEARTPLIISGPAPQTNQQYSLLQPKVERLYRKQLQLVEQLFTNVEAEATVALLSPISLPP